MFSWPGLSRTFSHGIHPQQFKQLTADSAIERMPFIDEYVLPLSQHLGAPSKPIVSVGQRVSRGQLIAEAVGLVSANLHASVTGTVKSIGPHHHASGKISDAIILRADPNSPQVMPVVPYLDWQSASQAELLQMLRDGGFVGLGGAAFPTHAKFTVPKGKHARFFIINAAECEPFLTTDYRLMVEHPADVILGTRICLKILGSERAYIGIEADKPAAMAALRAHLPADLPCEVVPLQPKYPQGAEKMLIEAVLRKEVPSGRLPIDVEVVVNNVGTVAGIGQMARTSQPLIERVVTLTGPGITRPSNLLVPIGTRLSDAIDHCGGLKPSTRQILFGGPMMGVPQRYLDVPIMKGTSGILCLTEAEIIPRGEGPCIRCSRCVDACPVFLNPSRLGLLAKQKHYEEMLSYHVMDCVECGSCSFVCPSYIPLVQRIRVAKGLLREQKARQEAARKP